MRLAQGVRYPIHEPIRRRSSARAFEPRALEELVHDGRWGVSPAFLGAADEVAP